MLQYSRTSDILMRGGCSLDNSYYLFCGSFGDRWVIASMLGHLFDHDDKAYVLAATGDMELLRIFLGERMNRVIPVDENFALEIRWACKADPHSYMPSADSSTALRASPQRGCIRSLHIVDYPYFVELNLSRYVRYINLLRIIMHIPEGAMMAMPPFLDSADEERAEAVLRDAGLLNCKSAIVNPVNFTHRALSLETCISICDLLKCRGYKVAFNIAQSSDAQMASNLKHGTGASIISMPGHLLKTIYDKVSLCVGSYGGAMTIAIGFGGCNVFSVYTPCLFFEKLNYASIDIHEFEMMLAEPRPAKPRLLRGSSFVAGAQVEEFNLIECELEELLNHVEQL